MAGINLLPKDLLPQAAIIKFASLLKNLVIIGFFLFILAGGGLIAFLVFNSVELSRVNQQSQQLQNSIRSLEQTEQRFVLLKDRLGKVRQVLDKESSGNAVNSLNSLIPTLPENAFITEAIVSSKELETTFLVTSSSSLTRLLGTIVTLDEFTLTKLISFSFNPNLGYVLSLNFSLE
jgi:hypothetical protein